MNWHRFFRQLSGVVYLPNRDEYFTRLRASAPTVTADEARKLKQRWGEQKPGPIDLDGELPIG